MICLNNNKIIYFTMKCRIFSLTFTNSQIRVFFGDISMKATIYKFTLSQDCFRVRCSFDLFIGLEVVFFFISSISVLGLHDGRCKKVEIEIGQSRWIGTVTTINRVNVVLKAKTKMRRLPLSHLVAVYILNLNG